MRGQKIPLDRRAQAVGIAAVVGIAEASRQTGISEPAIHKWFHSPEYEELRSRKNDELVEEWRLGVQLSFRRSVDLLAQTEDPVKAATAGAIIFDKMQLASGGVTSRTESTLLAGRGDHEQRLLGDIINAELERRADADADGTQGPDPVAQLAAREAGTTGG